MGALIGWLSKVDPNVAISVLTFVSTAATWAWRRVRGKEQASFKSTINSAIDALVLEVFDAHISDGDLGRVNLEGFLHAARDRAEKTIWAVMVKRGIPRTAATERYVHEAIERASSELAKELAERRKRALNTPHPGVTVST
jgi:hypothetical protein